MHDQIKYKEIINAFFQKSEENLQTIISVDVKRKTYQTPLMNQRNSSLILETIKMMIDEQALIKGAN